MEIISHRGYWKNNLEKNNMIAFERSFSLGYGTETDVRDLKGKIVISHDMPTGGEVSFDDFLNLYKSSGITKTLALNIKSDGLCEKLKNSLEYYNIDNYFVFDMSIPDTIQYLNFGLNTHCRYSEYESENGLWCSCSGIWYDLFNANNFNIDIIVDSLNRGKKVCIVSAELHGHDRHPQWKNIKELPQDIFNSEDLILCTDVPEEAEVFFYDKKN